MKKSEDALARARSALSQVDAELDLSRTHARALTRARSRTDHLIDPDDDAVHGVEILRHGQHPSLPRHRAALWALAATVVLLGGAGLGTAALWQGSDETVPGAPAPGTHLPTDAPSTGQLVEPRECTSLPPPPTPTAGAPDEDGSGPQTAEDCAVEPSPAPSDGQGSTDTAAR